MLKAARISALFFVVVESIGVVLRASASCFMQNDSNTDTQIEKQKNNDEKERERFESGRYINIARE